MLRRSHRFETCKTFLPLHDFCICISRLRLPPINSVFASHVLPFSVVSISSNNLKPSRISNVVPILQVCSAERLPARLSNVWLLSLYLLSPSKYFRLLPLQLHHAITSRHDQRCCFASFPRYGTDVERERVCFTLANECRGFRKWCSQ